MQTALHESGMQLQSQRMELYRANQLSDHSQIEKSWLCTELDRTERLLQEESSGDRRFEKDVLYRS